MNDDDSLEEDLRHKIHQNVGKKYKIEEDIFVQDY